MIKLSCPKIVAKFPHAAFVGSATFLLICGYLGTTTVTAVTFLTLGVGLGGLALAGFAINHLDIAPMYAGLLMGLTNTAATLPGIVGPQVAKVIAAEVSMCMCVLCWCFIFITMVTDLLTVCPTPNFWWLTVG